MIDLKQGDCLELMKDIPDKSVDAVVTDPPYEYLNHRLDKHFDETTVFREWNRIMKDDGFILFFGRGESFHRWNYLLNKKGWNFKEEVIWNKRRTSSPMLPIGRVHETISILSKNGKVNKVKVPYIEKNKYDLKKINDDISRISSAINNPKELKMIQDYLSEGQLEYYRGSVDGIALSGKIKVANAGLNALRGVVNGKNEQDIISEVSIRNRKKQFHPTQKPISLMQRLIKLVSNDSDIIFDPFMGSGSTGVAAVNLNRNFIGYELEQDYFDIATDRINKAIEDHK